jgi:bacterioferritin-associated ferredoxin
MIVCSCNVISSREIESAVEELVATDADVVLTPGMVYRTFGCRPKCGTCLRNLAELMCEHRESLQAPDYLPPRMDRKPETV